MDHCGELLFIMCALEKILSLLASCSLKNFVCQQKVFHLLHVIINLLVANYRVMAWVRLVVFNWHNIRNVCVLFHDLPGTIDAHFIHICIPVVRRLHCWCYAVIMLLRPGHQPLLCVIDWERSIITYSNSQLLIGESEYRIPAQHYLTLRVSESYKTL